MGRTAQRYDALWVSADHVLLSVARVWIASRCANQVRKVCDADNRSTFSISSPQSLSRRPAEAQSNQLPVLKHWLCSLDNADKQIKQLIATGAFAIVDACGKELAQNCPIKNLLIVPKDDSAFSLVFESDVSIENICLNKHMLLQLFEPAEAFEADLFNREDWTGEMAAYYLAQHGHGGYLDQDRPPLNATAYFYLDSLLQQSKVSAFKNGLSLDRGYWFGKSIRNNKKVYVVRSSVKNVIRDLEALNTKGLNSDAKESYGDTLDKLSTLDQKPSSKKAADFLRTTHSITQKAAVSIVEKDGRFTEAKPGRPPKNAVSTKFT